MWELFFCVDSTQILLLKLKTAINRVSLYISAEDSRKLGCGLTECKNCVDSDSNAVAAAGVADATAVVAKEMANANQTVEVEAKFNNQLS